MKKYFILTAFLLLSLISNAQNWDIYFDTDQHHIRENESYKLNEINANCNFSCEILLRGHCDQAGTDVYNIALAERRVNAVKDALILQGISPLDIRTEIIGEAEALAVAQVYRRVQILVTKKVNATVYTPPKKEVTPVYQPKENPSPLPEVVEQVVEEKITEPVPVPNEKVKEPTFGSVADFFESIQPEKQTFTVSANEEQFIIGEKGTELFIPENAFVDKNGNPVKGNVEIEFTEYTTKKEFISKRLSTISKGNIIKSLGMVKVDAFADGEEVKLAEGKNIELFFSDSDEIYNTFYAEENDMGGIEWEVDPEFSSKRQPILDDFGVTTNMDGNGLELVDKSEVKKRNRNARLNGMQGIIVEATPEYLDSVNRARDSINAEWLARMEILRMESERINDSLRIERERINDSIGLAGEKRLADSKKISDFLDTRRDVRTAIQSRKLGFINCDRFLKRQIRDTEIMVRILNEDVEVVNGFLVFEKLNSVIEIHRQRIDIIFDNALLPKNEAVTLLVVGKDVDNGIYYTTHEFKLEKKNSFEFTLEKGDYTSLGEIMDEW